MKTTSRIRSAWVYFRQGCIAAAYVFGLGVRDARSILVGRSL